MSKINLQKSGLMNINKFLVTGHPASRYELVANVLNSGGMPFAKSSRREGLTPLEISDALLKAHQYGSAGILPGSGEIRQLAVSPVWNGLALDLMLGNIDQKFWCWADAQAVSLLEYWKSLDTQLAFVLVYETPQDLIARAFSEAETLTPGALEARLDEWSAYNNTLLRFYHRNAERSLLVHASQVRADGAAYLQHVRSQTGLPLLPEAGDMTDAGLAVSAPESALYRHLAEAFLEEKPDAMQLYAELQSVADLPLENPRTEKISVEELLSAAVQMKSKHRQMLQTADEKAKTLELENQTLSEKLLKADREREAQAAESGLLLSNLHEVQEQLEQLRMQSQKQIAEHNENLASMTKERDEQVQENQLLLTQLHAVQEELEKQFVTNREEAAALNQAMELLKKEKAEQQKAVAEKQSRLEQLSQENQAKQKELEEKNGQLAALRTQNDQTRKERDEQLQENQLLLTQLHAVQEELEKQFVANREEAAALNQAMDLLKKEKAEQQKAVTEKQKELEERNGQLVTLKTQNDQTKKEKDAALKKLQEAEEVKSENELLLAQLHTVQEELEQYYLENVKLKKEEQKRKAKPYGAAERVKSQLSYRLGAKMIENSRSLGGWATMPAALVKETRRFRRDFAERAGQKLPPISHYADVHEAERVKKHLSYRLGKTMVEKSRSPIGLVTLPLALRRAVKEYRQERANA